MAGANHYTRFGPRVVGCFAALAACASSGCWQEVRYTGPTNPGAAEQRASGAPPTAEFASDARGFGDDLVAALAAQPASHGGSDTGVQPAVSVSSAERAMAGERYEPAATERSTNGQGFLGAEYGIQGQGTSTPAPPAAESAAASGAALPRIESAPASAATNAGRPRQPSPPAAVNPIRSAEPTPAAVPTPPALTRRAAWLLGSKWSLAALARGRGAVNDNVNNWLEQAGKLALFLGTKLEPLPPPLSDREVSTRATVRHLFAEGQRLGRDLAERHGPAHAALFELGVKSNLLLVLYEPGTPVAETLGRAIADARPLADSPAELWQPLLDAIAQGREPAAVRQLVLQLHDEVDRSLAGSAER